MAAPTQIGFLLTSYPRVAFGVCHLLDLGALAPPSIGAHSLSPFNPLGPHVFQKGVGHCQLARARPDSAAFSTLFAHQSQVSAS